MNNFAFLLNWRLRCNILCGIGADCSITAQNCGLTAFHKVAWRLI